mgnify:CR=1 FL=1
MRKDSVVLIVTHTSHSRQLFRANESNVVPCKETQPTKRTLILARYNRDRNKATTRRDTVHPTPVVAGCQESAIVTLTLAGWRMANSCLHGDFY